MQNQDRQDAIREKGFDMLRAPTSAVDSYARIKLGSRPYDDAVLDLHYYEKLDRREFKNKGFVMQALINNDIPLLREISRFYYRTNGIYQKIVN